MMNLFTPKGLSPVLSGALSLGVAIPLPQRFHPGGPLKTLAPDSRHELSVPVRPQKTL